MVEVLHHLTMIVFKTCSIPVSRIHRGTVYMHPRGVSWVRSERRSMVDADYTSSSIIHRRCLLVCIYEIIVQFVVILLNNRTIDTVDSVDDVHTHLNKPSGGTAGRHRTYCKYILVYNTSTLLSTPEYVFCVSYRVYEYEHSSIYMCVRCDSMWPLLLLVLYRVIML